MPISRWYMREVIFPNRVWGRIMRVMTCLNYSTSIALGVPQSQSAIRRTYVSRPVHSRCARGPAFPKTRHSPAVYTHHSAAVARKAPVRNSLTPHAQTRSPIAMADMPKMYTDEELEEKYVWVGGGLLDKPRWEKVGAPKMTGMVVGNVEKYDDVEEDTSFVGQIMGIKQTSKKLREILPAKHPQSVHSSPTIGPTE